MSEYCLFQPGEYMDFEKEEVQLRWDIYHGKRAMPGPPGMPPMDPDDEDSLPPFMRPRRYTEEEIIAYNKKWNPYDPLYNDPAYARAHGHPSVPAYPGFEAMPPIMVVPQFPKNMPSRFYYTNDGTDIRYNRNIYAGDLLRESAGLARALGVRLHTHVAETRDEEDFTLQKFGLRPLAYMESLGWVGPDVWYAHGIHFNDGELRRLAETGTGVAHCPISNMKLSSGVCRVPEMLRLGVPVGLAVDGAASNDGSNLLEELRVCYLLHRLQSSQSAPTGYDILKLATRGSARLLGRDDIGCLAAGMAADCFLISLDRIELAGAQFDPLSLLGTVGLKGPVDYTIVNGMAVVQNGELVTADEGELAARANAAVCRYLGRC